MPAYSSLEAAVDPNHRLTFLLDWELTLKCNLDCSYCATPATISFSEASHDPNAQHPPLSQCLDTIDFMFNYVDLYMALKTKWSRAVVLNLYGGESLTHPDIVEICKQVRSRYQAFKNNWSLKIICTTNAVIGRRRMLEVMPYIDEFTVSYHAESLSKQKKQVMDNLQLLKNNNKDVKCIILMHGNNEYWPDLIEVIDFCKQNTIEYHARNLDGPINSTYNQQQIKWFKNQWSESVSQNAVNKQVSMVANRDDLEESGTTLSDVGRACCGGRLLCQDQDMRHPIYFTTDNNFFDWYCSVNWFFLFIKQQTGEVFLNKDCRMSFDGTVSPVGYLANSDRLLEDTKARLQAGTIPLVRCKKSLCKCGLCAPKAEQKSVLETMMKKYIQANTSVF